jgi:hypothetical protein
VFAADSDPIDADLRYLRGLRVHVGPYGESFEWHAWWDAIVQAGPSEVFGCHPQTMEVQTWQR